MRRTFCTVVAAGVLVAGSGAAAEPKLVTQPDWLQRPRGEDLEEAYPKVAEALGLQGRASITCRVSSDGQLKLCETTSEAPLGLGFGKAAVSMSSLFQMRPMTVAGHPVGGGRITIPITFRLPAAPAIGPLPSAKDADPRALEIAGRLLDLFGLSGDGMSKDFEDQANRIELLDDEVTPLDTRAAAGAALRKAAAAHVDDARKYAVLVLGSSYTAAELEPAARSLASPLSAPARPNADVEAVKEMINRDAQRRLRVLVRRTYCASHDCDPAKVALADSHAEIELPTFVQGPTRQEAVQARPAILGYIASPVAARLRCLATADGGLSDCVVVSESPAGLGWGAAASGLAPRFRLAPVLMSQGAAGETVALTIGLPADELDEPFTAPAAKSPAALVLGREYVEAGLPLAEARLAERRSFADLDGEPPPGADPAVYKAAVEMVLSLSDQVLVDSREQYAQTYGAVFSLDQLRAAIDFERTAGRVLAAKQPQVWGAMRDVAMTLDRDVRADARAIYCKDRPCDAGLSPPAH